MNFQNFTIKSQEVVQKAVQIAQSNQNQVLEPVHLLKAVMSDDDSVVKFVFQKLDVAATMIERSLDEQLSRLPKVSGGEPYLSSDSNKVFEKANAFATENGDQYVTVEAILVGLLSVNSPASKILKDAGATEDALKMAIKESHWTKRRRAVQRSEEICYQSLRTRTAGQTRPGYRP